LETPAANFLAEEELAPSLTLDTERTFKILIVDDDAINRQVLQNILSLKHYEVTQASNGFEALDLFEQGHLYDLMILDVMMPRMSGYEVNQRIRERYPPDVLPVVMLTAKNQGSDLVTGLQAGANDYIYKPFDKDVLLARVNTLLNLKQTQDELRQSEAKYRAIFEETRDMIFVAAPDGQIIEVSPACEVLLGYTRAEALQMKVQDVYENKAQAKEFWWRVTEQQTVKDFEVKLRHKAGHHIEALVTASLRQLDEETYLGFQGIVRDITAQKQAERERLKLLAIQRDLHIAQQIQESLLPPPQPEWSDLEVICYFNPAQEVGGDFYSYHAFTAPQPTYALVIGDVSGKGVSAALLMATSLAQFDASLALNFPDPASRLVYLDRVISPYTQPRQQNCAMCYLEIERLAEGEVLAKMINAACIPPYLKRATGQVEQPELGGFALGQGLGAEHGYQQETVTLWTGDLFILTSDGVVEANNEAGELLGFDRLSQIIATGPTTSAQAMLDHLEAAISTFTGQAPQHDDMTIIVGRV
jgi:PAS domain S-box-containing protein